MIAVTSVWFLVEFITWAAFGWPTDWWQLATVIITFLLAVLTFPHSKPPPIQFVTDGLERLVYISLDYDAVVEFKVDNSK